MARILLLEADSLLAGHTRRFFERSGHRLESFADPQAAILAADAQKPDLVILDLQLAGRSGLEFLYELRSYPEWQDLPAVVLTSLDAQSISGYADSLSQLKVAAVFHKPQTTHAQLLARVERLLQPVA